MMYLRKIKGLKQGSPLQGEYHSTLLYEDGWAISAYWLSSEAKFHLRRNSFKDTTSLPFYIPHGRHLWRDASLNRLENFYPIAIFPDNVKSTIPRASLLIICAKAKYETHKISVFFLSNHYSQFMVAYFVSFTDRYTFQVNKFDWLSVDLHVRYFIFFWLFHFYLEWTTPLKYLLAWSNYPLKSKSQLVLETDEFYHSVVYLLFLKVLSCFWFFNIHIWYWFSSPDVS